MIGSAVWCSASLCWPGCSGCGEPPAADSEQTTTPVEARTYRWKLITTWPKNLPALGTIPERMTERVRLMSNGRLDIKVYGAGELVGAFEVFDAVSQGTAEMGNGASYYWRSKLPIAAIFSTVPFGLDRPGDEWLAALRRRPRALAGTLCSLSV